MKSELRESLLSTRCQLDEEHVLGMNKKLNLVQENYYICDTILPFRQNRRNHVMALSNAPLSRIGGSMAIMSAALRASHNWSSLV